MEKSQVYKENIDIEDEELEFISNWTSETNLKKLKTHILITVEKCKENFHAYKCIESLKFLKPRITSNFGYKDILD